MGKPSARSPDPARQRARSHQALGRPREDLAPLARRRPGARARGDDRVEPFLLQVLGELLGRQRHRARAALVADDHQSRRGDAEQAGRIRSLATHDLPAAAGVHDDELIDEVVAARHRIAVEVLADSQLHPDHASEVGREAGRLDPEVVRRSEAEAASTAAKNINRACRFLSLRPGLKTRAHVRARPCRGGSKDPRPRTRRMGRIGPTRLTDVLPVLPVLPSYLWMDWSRRTRQRRLEVRESSGRNRRRRDRR